VLKRQGHLLREGLILENIIVIVGFLGAGKTTLLKKVVKDYLDNEWNPFVILNDYENARLDAQDFLTYLKPEQVNALSGSCICCSGINELRENVNKVLPRRKGVTLIEANGTTDAVSLMGFLGVGVKKHFSPPIQIAVVDVRNWQKRGEHNELESNQIQVSSVIVLNYINQVDIERVVEVEQDLRVMNSKARLIHWDEFAVEEISDLSPSENKAQQMEHKKAHWSSCSVDLPDPIDSGRLTRVINSIPSQTLRVKGCTRVDKDEHYSHFERIPNGEVFVRPYNGTPITGPKLLTIGPGSDPNFLIKLIQKS
jgi:G3E family GTPase